MALGDVVVFGVDRVVAVVFAVVVVFVDVVDRDIGVIAVVGEVVLEALVVVGVAGNSAGGATLFFCTLIGGRRRLFLKRFRRINRSSVICFARSRGGVVVIVGVGL